ncbi:MAG: YtxH domain-containing protein [Anaerolineae bacterium]|jgi:gas vesicle protein
MGKTTSGDFFAGFVIGALVGAAATLLLAPQSGEQTRSLIREKGVELGQRADELSVEARRRAEELQVEARQRAEELQTEARQRAEMVQTQARERAGQLQGRVKQAVEEGRAAAADKREELLSQLEKGQSAEETSA